MKILFISLGCDKNLVDTEEMLGLLSDSNYTFTDNEEEADIVIINTCCFIHDAKTESIETIISMARLKEEANCKLLIATGCLATRYKDEILKEIPEIDVILGTSSIDKIAEAINAAFSDKKEENKVFMDSINRLPIIKNRRINTTGGWYSYLKISEGCDKFCTYCIIPKIRGRHRSLPMDFLINRAKELVENGVTELILVAQDLTAYGKDLAGKKMILPQLLKNLAAIQGLRWIRLLYCYPEDITDELIDIIKNEPKICKYIDMPIQHISDNILKQMGRKTTSASIEKIIRKLRKEIPEIALRTTLITGFPGESEYDFNLLKDFVLDSEFDRLGVFTYSIEEGTPAATFKNQIAEEVKQQRKDEIMQIQQKICEKKSFAMIGKKLNVIIDGYLPEEDVYVARTYKDTPGVDGNLYIELDLNDSRDLMSGTYVDVSVTKAAGYDLIGRIVK